MAQRLVTVDGINSTVATLRAMDRAMVTQFNRALRGAVNQVRDQARAAAPTRSGAMRRGFVVRKGRQSVRHTGWRVESRTAQGAILELAAEGHTAQGRSLVDSLTARYGQPGRFLWQAWDDQAPAVYGAMAAAVRAAEADINTRLGKAG